MKREWHPLTADEKALASTLRETLNRAAEQHDPMLDAALAATRAQALASHRLRRPQAWLLAGGIAVATSVAVLVILPNFRAPASPSVSVVDLAAMPPVDPQLLEDMDLLLALGEHSNGG